MRIAEIKLYKYKELSDEAKEVVRNRYRQYQLDHEWYDSVYEAANRAAKVLGISINRKSHGGYSLAIYFSGFSSQGDGACFEGSYSYAKRAPQKLAESFGDTELVRIAERLMAIQKRNFFGLSATIAHRGRYYHSGCTLVDVEAFAMAGERREVSEIAEDTITECMRDFMHWIYCSLEKEHDYLTSDEAVEESLIANEYEFRADGSSA